MDPVTAGFQAATAVCALLTSPQGQVLLAQMIALNGTIARDLANVVAFVGAHVPQMPAPNPAPTH